GPARASLEPPHRRVCMRRAIALLIPILCAALVPLAAHGRSRAKAIMNAVGLIDYSSKPAFKPGDWVRYHVVGANNQGDTDDYYVTILIAGEERFWGEDCFWVETRTLAAGSTAPVVVATLMSYSAFDDSLGLLHMKYF